MYSKFFNGLSESIILPEEKVDCHQCEMASQNIYKQSLKCCTYHPFLANYSVGGILLEGDKSADIILQKIEQSEFVLPLGVMPSWAYRVNHKFKKAEDFGNREDLLCPFFDRLNGDCQIWNFRNGACQSFYCESTYGRRGKEFWGQWGKAMHHLETSLSQDVLIMMGYDWEEIETQLSYFVRKENQIPARTCLSSNEAKDLWQHYWGKEVDFFIKAYSYMQELEFSDYIKILGDEGMNMFSPSLLRLMDE